MTLCGSQMFRRANLGLVGLAVLLVSNVAHAAPPTAITTCPFFITTPGQYYLANDLLGCPGPGITIRASGVHLRLDGHTIQGSGEAHGIDAVGQTSILIQGPGTVIGFAVGLSFINVDFSNVVELTAIQNEIGFSLTNLLTSSSNHNLLQGNAATESAFDGIFILGGIENNVVNNLVTNNGVLSGVGIGLVASDLNEIHANIVTGNAGRGISLEFSTQNNLDGNTALGNGLFDMVDESPDCDDNQWQGNRFVTAFPSSCIQ